MCWFERARQNLLFHKMFHSTRKRCQHPLISFDSYFWVRLETAHESATRPIAVPYLGEPSACHHIVSFKIAMMLSIGITIFRYSHLETRVCSSSSFDNTGGLWLFLLLVCRTWSVSILHSMTLRRRISTSKSWMVALLGRPGQRTRRHPALSGRGTTKRAKALVLVTKSTEIGNATCHNAIKTCESKRSHTKETRLQHKCYRQAVRLKKSTYVLRTIWPGDSLSACDEFDHDLMLLEKMIVSIEEFHKATTSVGICTKLAQSCSHLKYVRRGACWKTR